MPTSRKERALRDAGFSAIAGVDEAGRGALFGPVFAAAVVLDRHRQIRGLDDSKQLIPERREVLADRIRERARAWAIGEARDDPGSRGPVAPLRSSLD
jgi:ribonuclease HII